MSSPICLMPVEDLPEIRAGVDIAALVAGRLRACGVSLAGDDVVVIAQKIVSKAEGRQVDLREVIVSERARGLAAATGKDPRLVEVVLAESTEVIRTRPGVLIVRHKLGFVMAQAGVDRSNVPGDHSALLLPLDPDASAQRLMRQLSDEFGLQAGPAVVISDSFGRPWRVGTTNVAIGVAGCAALIDRRGEADRSGRRLEVTQVAWADAIAAAAGLLMGEGNEGIPAVVVRGLPAATRAGRASDLVRPMAEDLFR